MKVAFFDSHSFEKNYYQKHEFTFFETKLSKLTANLASGFPVVCAFVNDTLDRATLEILKNGGVQLVTLRCAGVNQVDLKSAKEFGIKVTLFQNILPTQSPSLPLP